MKDFKTTYGSLAVNAWPATVAKNASGPSAVDGTPFCADLINDLWAWQENLMNLAGIAPSGVSDTYSLSDVVNAIRRAGQQPGLIVNSCLNATMLALCRFLPLTGQVVAVASYPDLVTATYCGDANNASAPAFYKTSDAGGATRSTTGAYFVLPDAKGLVVRGIGNNAKIQPVNAAYYYTGGTLVGYLTTDAMMGHMHNPASIFGFSTSGTGIAAGSSGTATTLTGPVTDGTFGTPRTTYEMRPASIGAQLCITY